MIFTLWKARQAQRRKAESLYRAVMTQTRRPEFYVNGGIADTFEGRFDLLVVHVALVLFRLKGEGEAGKAVGQQMFDLFFADMDAALREMGVGDTSVGKRVREMSEAFYGRLESYDGGLSADETDRLRMAVERNLYGAQDNTENAPQAAAMAVYMRAAADHMKCMSLDGLGAEGLFPDPPAFGAAQGRPMEGLS